MRALAALTRRRGSSANSESFTVETFNGHDNTPPAAMATFVGLQERAPNAALRVNLTGLRLFAPTPQEAIAWQPRRFEVHEADHVRLHGDGRSYGHPNTTPVRYALWVAGVLDGQWPVAIINTHLVNNAYGPAIRGERRLRRRLWRKGWRIVKRLRRRLEDEGYVVLIVGDLNRTVRWWEHLTDVVGRGFDRIIYRGRLVDVLETWEGKANGSDHRPLFARLRIRGKAA